MDKVKRKGIKISLNGKVTISALVSLASILLTVGAMMGFGFVSPADRINELEQNNTVDHQKYEVIITELRQQNDEQIELIKVLVAGHCVEWSNEVLVRSGLKKYCIDFGAANRINPVAQ